MAEYGIPYMGSKSSICDAIVRIFPKAKNFYDLFGGGFSVTHAMLLRRSKDFKFFHFNEIRPGVCELVRAAVKGEYSYQRFLPPWVSREEFLLKKDVDAYIKLIWSFGNNGQDYMFSKEIEPYKRSMHMAIIFNEFDDLAAEVLGMRKFNPGYLIKHRRLFLRNKIEYYRRTGVPAILHQFINLQRLEQLEQLQQLQQLEQLQQLQQLQQLYFYSQPYDQIVYDSDSVVYCDPPYKETVGYDHAFDHDGFLNWASSQKCPVFISEYEVSDRRFHLVMNINKRSTLGGAKKNMIEKVYLNEFGARALARGFKPRCIELGL